MANIKSFHLPGMIVEKKPIKDLDGGKSVINFVVSYAQEVVEGFTEEIEKTIVLFSRKAIEADNGIEEGDFVVFSGCKRNPRTYTTLSGNTVEQLDIIAEQFKVVDIEQFENITAALVKAGKVPDMSDLAFTDEDAEALITKNLQLSEPDIG